MYFYYIMKKENSKNVFLNILFVFNKNHKEWINLIGALGYSDDMFYENK